MCESSNTDSSLHLNSFADCGEAIKVEDIKEEIKEEENVEDPLSLQGNIVKGDIVKEEVIDYDSLSAEDLNNSREEEKFVVADNIDIVEYKIETII